MNDLCIVIRRAPYGWLAAAEGVRHLIGAVAAGMSVSAVLVDDGAYLARQGQDSERTGWTNLSDALGQALEPRAAGRCPGVEWIGATQFAAVLASADALLIF